MLLCPHDSAAQRARALPGEPLVDAVLAEDVAAECMVKGMGFSGPLVDAELSRKVSALAGERVRWLWAKRRHSATSAFKVAADRCEHLLRIARRDADAESRASGL